jgi:uncharacterized protein (DUF427 family)
MEDFPAAFVPPSRVQPVPRRIRAVAASHTVVDTTRAWYGWESDFYPQYYIPLDDVRMEFLRSEERAEKGPFGEVEIHSLQIGDETTPGAGRVVLTSTQPELNRTVRFEWGALDSWYEEDEQVFVHPRNPYVRVDALRSTRTVRIELDGAALAESSSPVLVFETGLPTRYYLNRTDVDFSHLVLSETVTECPYKGTTSAYWSSHIGDHFHRDVAWSYDFPARQLLPIAGLVAFYNEKVEITVDGLRLERPRRL